VFVYGPFRVSGNLVDSNQRFDESLRSRCAEWGVRDLESVSAAAAKYELCLLKVVDMPANNLSLIFKRVSSDDTLDSH
jgi:hypothetical protein